MDLQPAAQRVDDRGEIAQVLVADVDPDQVVEPVSELDQHGTGTW
jgi:hypothetical protein